MVWEEENDLACRHAYVIIRCACSVIMPELPVVTVTGAHVITCAGPESEALLRFLWNNHSQRF